jgi:hypothetical protein
MLERSRATAGEAAARGRLPAAASGVTRVLAGVPSTVPAPLRTGRVGEGDVGLMKVGSEASGSRELGGVSGISLGAVV